ncbi:MAG: threonylcarbamoyl-AMP synthase [Candidatus Magasanikbacteria bacterium CG10_big_fil_rev_8_21_14_0_10_47_10]|uniref:L-threonylcarbamoyladenylate synthase n=1 Tax=Candidatus Magasanikbacteria bacterium CG10_big_fil_rev_8_21_14_0_10_47_10 TaxID=1974652 RepID=A0A2H0TTQ8_9BACT|nr:MAG: threonylcarbamoyl-AMP synthase [Candidatus Magasanikbacteria bacterium CG10_big_fil_rev_8_21_14_0_10_47_10]
MHIISKSDINIEDIVLALEQGKIIVYPTETCYGLGCDMENDVAVQRIFAIKKRQQEKSVLVIVHDIAMVQRYVVWNEILERLAEQYWPGPLTIVAPLRDDVNVAVGISAEDKTLAFRVSDYPLAHDICQALGRPLVSTSANIASFESPYDIASVCTMFEHADEQPDIIIDAGTLVHHPPSTIVRVLHNEVEILRQGEIKVEVDNIV